MREERKTDPRDEAPSSSTEVSLNAAALTAGTTRSLLAAAKAAVSGGSGANKVEVEKERVERVIK